MSKAVATQQGKSSAYQQRREQERSARPSGWRNPHAVCPYGHRQETEDAPTQHGRAPQAQEDGRGVSPCEECSSIDQTCKEAAPPAWLVETSGGKGQLPTICRRRMKTWTASRASGRRGRGPQTLRRRSGHRGGAAVGCPLPRPGRSDPHSSGRHSPTRYPRGIGGIERAGGPIRILGLRQQLDSLYYRQRTRL